ncbi:MAG: hypothetical protein DRQ57_05835 [Gammaproteobacteria bacterium]|nr:MAG: hypothetical protein DRQ57_05835 [Gammaproteobacteria bacterium]
MIYFKFPLLFSLLLALEIALAGVFEPQSLDKAYVYLNQLRASAGLTEFSQNPQLEIAAFNHANYLADNFMTGHYEAHGTFRFTGVSPKDRTINAGYRSLSVSENVSTGNANSIDYNANSIDSIDRLMSAIYHRFGFLDFVHNEIGIGIAKVSLEDPNSYSAYTYNMGNTEYNALCEGPAFSGSGHYYLNICEPNININANTFENVKVKAMGNNPNIVVWPVSDSNNVPPVFFEESPDPLPDYSISGYPISIQFNPLVFTQVNISTFKLYREQDNSEVQPTRLLSQSTDPNGKFSTLQYALFPLKRLDWNRAYWAKVEYTSNLGDETLRWRFETKNLGVPLFTVQGEHEEILIPKNTPTFVVYVPPTLNFPNIGKINYTFPSGTTVETAFEDSNTLWINISAKIDQEIHFNFSGTRHFIVKMTLEESLEETVEESLEETLEECEQATFFSKIMHIPTLYYSPSHGIPIMLWADLELISDKLFKVKHYGFKDKTAEPCETTATLSQNMNLHIPVAPEELMVLFPNWHSSAESIELKYAGDLQFQIVTDNFSPTTTFKHEHSEQNLNQDNTQVFLVLMIILMLIAIVILGKTIK